MTTDNVRKALQWLDDKGWSELIDERWTIDVYHELQTSGLNLTDAEIREALDIVIYKTPDYNPTHNERLTRGMTTDSPRYLDCLEQMRQCKTEAETEDPNHPGFYNLCEPQEKADDILCNLIIDLGFEEIVNIYKSFEKWHA